MIGLSLHVCVKDITSGRVPYEEVEKIVASTRAANEGVWVAIVVDNMLHEGWGVPEADMLDRLRSEGKIEQPRLTIGDYPNLANGVYWVHDESDIKWTRRVGVDDAE